MRRRSKSSSRKIRLLAHNVRSLWNVGAFFRTADAFRVEKIYLTGYTGTPPRKEIAKTALGAEGFVDWENARDPMVFIDLLAKEGWDIVALELRGDAIDLWDYPPGNKVCLIVGNELDGVPEGVLDACNQIVSIPMLGKKESLNVAVAAGIALAHLRNG